MIVQLLIAALGLSSVYMSLLMPEGSWARKLAPVVGISGQPLWFYVTWSAKQWGMLVLSLAYTLVYVAAIYRQWGATRS